MSREIGFPRRLGRLFYQKLVDFSGGTKTCPAEFIGFGALTRFFAQSPHLWWALTGLVSTGLASTGLVSHASEAQWSRPAQQIKGQSPRINVRFGMPPRRLTQSPHPSRTLLGSTGLVSPASSTWLGGTSLSNSSAKCLRFLPAVGEKSRPISPSLRPTRHVSPLRHAENPHLRSASSRGSIKPAFSTARRSAYCFSQGPGRCPTDHHDITPDLAGASIATRGEFARVGGPLSLDGPCFCCFRGSTESAFPTA